MAEKAAHVQQVSLLAGEWEGVCWTVHNGPTAYESFNRLLGEFIALSIYKAIGLSQT